jgi:hypothetical protein
MACNTSLESFQQGLQLCVSPCLNQRSRKEVMGFQSGESPNFENFGTLNLGVLRKMTFGCNTHGNSQRIL